MIDRRDNRILDVVTKARWLGGASALALLGAGLAATPAAAQIGSPGSTQCPIVAGTVTCTGDISDGFRSDNNPDMRVLTLIALTEPIAPPPNGPVIDIRTGNDLTMTFDPTVIINATRPISAFSIPTGTFSSGGTEIVERPRSAVALHFDPARQSTADIRNAGTINTTLDLTGALAADYAGGLTVNGAANVAIVNSGAINVRLIKDSSFSRQFSGIRVDGADQISLLNSGTISVINAAGSLAFADNIFHTGVDLRGRAIAFTNDGRILLDGDNSRPVSIVALQAGTSTGSISFVNNGRIELGSDPQLIDPILGHIQTETGLLVLLGGGSVDFRNTGTISGLSHRIYTSGTAAGQSQTINVNNSGTLTNSVIEGNIGPNFDFDFDQEDSYDRYDPLTRVLPQNVSLTLANSGVVNGGGFDFVVRALQSDATFTNSANATDARFRVGLFDGQSRLNFVNTGDITNGREGFEFGLSAAAAETTFRNEGDLSSRLAGGGVAIEVGGESVLDVTNNGDLLVEDDGSEAGAVGIRVSQGFGPDPLFFFHPTFPSGPGRQFFQSTARIVNRGTIQITGQDRFLQGVGIDAYGDIQFDNSGAISVSGSRLNEGFDLTGVVLNGYSDVTFNSAAAISHTVTDDGPAGAAILLIERSIDPSRVAAALANGFLQNTYDQVADVNSRFAVNLTANVTANGRDQFGIFGYLGLADSVNNNRENNADFEGFAFTNNLATIVIDVPTGVSVTGGRGIGGAIAVEGTGNVTITNAGSIIGRGGAQSAAIHISDSAQLDPIFQFSGAQQVFLPDSFVTLRDTVNTGTIRSDGGHAIWAELGAIVNLTNRGLIFGGVGSVRALKTSSILNDTGGTLDGRILLEGAGSSLVNSGIIRVTTPGAVAHLVNGTFTQNTGGALVLRLGDSMNVTGNFALNGDLNLALGAPTLTPVFTVGGNLTLDGRLNVTDAGGFGSGVYRLFNYGGTLTDNGLMLSALPGGANGSIQTLIAGQVNLVVGGASVQFWDGSEGFADGEIDGGSGTWNNSTTNWTTVQAQPNDIWRGAFAIFQRTPGTVTIDPAGVSAQGLQFAIDGYRIEGGTLTLAAPATLRVGDGSAAGTGYSATIASIIAGSGGVDKTDLGTLVLSGANSYSGGTRVSGGVLQIGADNNLGAAAGGVTLDGGALRFGGALSSGRGFTIGAAGGTLDTLTNAVTLSGLLSGTGALAKTGSGVLTYSGNGSGYAGRFTIAGGSLRLDGSLGGTLQVNAGARLSGGGTLNNLDLFGTLAPGASIGTFTASGNAIFRAGSDYELEIAAAGGGDRLNVAGTATIEGGTVRVIALDPETQYVNGTRYTFLTAAGGRTGQFAGLTESSAFLDFALGYDATSAFLTVNVIRTFPDVALTFNQRQSSIALMGFGQTAGSDSLAVYNQILLLDADAARAAFDMASGEIYAVLTAATLRHGAGRAERLLGRSREAGGEGWGLWGTANGHDGRVQGDGNGARYTQDGIGGELGIDYRGPGNRWAIGFGGGYDTRDIDLRDRASRSEADGWHVGGYARYGTGGEGLSATLTGAYTSGKADVVRNIAIGTIARTAVARVDVDSWSLGGEVRYGFQLGGGWAAGPQLKASHARAELGRFAETGADSLNLSGGTNNEDSRTRYGGGLFARWEGSGGAIDVTAAYVGGGRAPTEIGLVMAGAPAAPYRVRSAQGDGDTLEITLAGQLELGRGWSIGANLEGAAGSNERRLQGSATLGWRF